MSQYPKHDGVVAWCQQQAAAGVHEVPDGSNTGPIQRHDPDGGVAYFQSFDFLAGGFYAWCVSFCQAAWAKGGKFPLPYKTAGAYDLARWAKEVGWARASRDCIPGDIIVFNIGTGHVGILINNSDPNYVVTIDGNTSNRVAVRRRPRSQVRCGVHVPEAAQPTHVQKPFWVVTTSEGGERKVVLTQFATQKQILGKVAGWLTKHGKTGLTIKRSKTTKKMPV